MHKHSLQNTPYKKIIALSSIVLLILCAMYLFIGMNIDNWEFFFPRRSMKIIAILVVSFCIGYSSLVFQTITNNKILTPSVMGLDSLYLFIQTVIIYFLGSKQLAMMDGYANFFISLGAMILCAWILFFLLFKRENRSVYFLILTGMIIGSLFQGLSTFMQVLLDPNEFSVLQGKMFASFNNINTSLLGISILVVCIIIWLSYKDLPSLDVLSLGKENAINLGIHYEKLVLKKLMIISVLVSISTVLVGPITFLGILIISLTRNIISTYRHSYMGIQVTLLGSIFLIAGLLIVERIFHFETTMSVIINFIGGTYFLYIMIKERKQ